MIEENLVQYGVLGLWTVSLLGERYIFQNKLAKSLDSLTKTIRESMVLKGGMRK